MLELQCKGSPFKVGLQHGEGAADLVKGSIDFYADMFKKYTGKAWEDILPIASEFEINLREKWPLLYEEMEGVAKGAGCDVLDVVALNVRTEIAYGLRLRSDGCTSLAWKTPNDSFLGQNWDWMEEQKRNLVMMTIHTLDRPTIKMVTEAGIIGKIGLNSSGVGVCLNAIRCSGYDSTRLPVHLGLRKALECNSAAEAIEMLATNGLAGSAHILVADASGSLGLEFTNKTIARLRMDANGRVMHTNHMIESHPGSDEEPEADSLARLDRLEEMLKEERITEGNLDLTGFQSFFDDHSGFPASICRAQEGESYDASLFNIIMDLTQKKAVLTVGKLCQPEETLEMAF